MYLLPALKSKLIRLYVERKNLTEAGEMLAPLIKEAKKLDDKALLVDIHLSASSYHLALNNIEKAQASLIACRASGSSTWIPHLLTAQIEQASGVLACLTGDYKTAFSFFYEAFEGFDTAGDRSPEGALVYMVLSKTVSGKHSEVPGILSGKNTLAYEGAMGLKVCLDVAKAAKEKAVKELASVATKYKEYIENDMLIRKTLETFHKKLLKENILRVLKSYSRVQIKHVANQTGLSYELIEKEIVGMILDGEIQGDMDHRSQVVNIYDDQPESTMYKDCVEIIEEQGRV